MATVPREVLAKLLRIANNMKKKYLVCELVELQICNSKV